MSISPKGAGGCFWVKKHHYGYQWQQTSRTKRVENWEKHTVRGRSGMFKAQLCLLKMILQYSPKDYLCKEHTDVMMLYFITQFLTIKPCMSPIFMPRRELVDYIMYGRADMIMSSTVGSADLWAEQSDLEVRHCWANGREAHLPAEHWPQCFVRVDLKTNISTYFCTVMKMSW